MITKLIKYVLMSLGILYIYGFIMGHYTVEQALPLTTGLIEELKQLYQLVVSFI